MILYKKSNFQTVLFCVFKYIILLLNPFSQFIDIIKPTISPKSKVHEKILADNFAYTMDHDANTFCGDQEMKVPIIRNSRCNTRKSEALPPRTDGMCIPHYSEWQTQREKPLDRNHQKEVKK